MPPVRAKRLLLVLCGALLLVGCARGAARSEADDAPAVSGASRFAAGTAITFFAESVPHGMKLDRALAERFERDTGVRVTLQEKPDSPTEGLNRLQASFKREPAAIDVLMVDVTWPGTLAAHLADLTPALGAEAAAHFPMIVRNNTIDGRLVAMPWFADAGLLYYRTDLLKKYGYAAPPATWDELEAMAKRIQAGERKVHKEFYGFVWQGKGYEGLTCNALEWQSSQGGGEIFHSDTGALDVTNPRAVAAFGRAASWVGTISPSGVTRFAEEDARLLFQSGRAVFMRNWPYACGALAAAGSPVRDRFDVTVLPHGETAERPAATLGGWQLAVSAASRQPEAAMALVGYLTSPEVQAYRAIKGGYLPTRRQAYERTDVLAARPYFKVMPAVLDGAVARPSNRARERYEQVSAAYFDGVSAILAGREPKAAAARMQKAIQSAME